MLVALLTGAPLDRALAHPHVWVTVRDTLVIADGKIAAVRHAWTFDEVYTTMAIEGLDKNGDGTYDRDELKELAQTNIDGLQEFQYFTYASSGADSVALGAPRDYWLEHSNNILTLHFDLPLATPLAANKPAFRVKVSDPSFFIAFEFAKEGAVGLSEGSPAGCKAELVKPEQSDEQKDLSAAFADAMPGAGEAGGSDSYELICK